MPESYVGRIQTTDKNKDVLVYVDQATRAIVLRSDTLVPSTRGVAVADLSRDAAKELIRLLTQALWGKESNT